MRARRDTRWERGSSERVVADEPEDLDRLLAGVLDGEAELALSMGALAVGLAEGVAGPVDHLERRLQRRVHLALLDEPAAQVPDDRRLLDPDRADLDPGDALHARPGGLAADPVGTDHAGAEGVSPRSPARTAP